MAIDGLIILDSTSRPIIQTSFRTTSPSYPLLHVDAVNEALQKTPNGQIDPIIYASSQHGPAACCHLKVGTLRLLCPIRGSEDPVFAFAFLQTFVDTLQEYLGEVSTASIKDNFDVVYQLLEEMLDDGNPLTTESSTLRDIVLPPSFYNKIMSLSGVSGLSKASANPFSSPIPWRKLGLKYNNNEIYFDLVEELDAVVDKAGVIVTSEVWGKAKSHSRLSGTPDLLLTFANPQTLSNLSFHPCIRIPRWIRDKALSFVPPDGKFVLFSYRYSPPSSNSLTAPSSTVPLPFIVKPKVVFEEKSATLEFVLSSRSRGPIENVVVELDLGVSAQGLNCTVPAGGTWGFDPKTMKLRWEIAVVSPSSTHVLSGYYHSSNGRPRPSRSLISTFSIPHHTFSSLKIDQLKLTGETYKPYKGMRGSGSGHIEWRI
ncbi:mu-adaptin 3 [Sistotremastrum suecicum HHB10207 ss-3]|uniref:Mu-adaptin 3 n=1 Tax=Sistotremastrum suecicum HHB10207 ss-3 TaxID=1314776 RepID=A0A166FYH5_9AGAM|nr:mu-adaptin 3 [Sistotremastrum suecicum HHB10207 ss-3]